MKKYFLFSFLIIFLLHNIYAVGIAQEFVKDNTLKLYPGQERLFELTMQNPDNVPVEMNLTVTGEIVSIKDRKEIYVLPPKSYNNIVYLNITVPDNAKVNQTYTLRYMMSPVAKNKTDPSIGIGLKISQPLYVLVIQKPIAEKEKKIFFKTEMTILIAAVILILSVWRLASLINKKINKKI